MDVDVSGLHCSIKFPFELVKVGLKALWAKFLFEVLNKTEFRKKSIFGPDCMVSVLVQLSVFFGFF